MDQSIYTGLINNTALLLVLTMLYDVFILRWQQKRTYPQKIITGILVGSICIGVMLNPWQLAPGTFFDTRSVLLSIAGLYIGTVPAITAVVMAGALRIFQGGSGMHMGVLVIITTMLIGLLWRNMRRGKRENPRLIELYLFGVIVHADMLLCTFALPAELRQMAVNTIAVPVMVVYPLATMLLGKLMNMRADQQKLDERLRESEARWQMAVESADAGIWDLDIPAMMVSFSRQGRAMLGYQPFETRMTYTEWLDIIHPADRARAEAEIQAALQEKTPFFISERRIRRADGSYHWVMTRGRISERDQNGKPLRMSGIVADISARKQADEERARLFEIIDASPSEVFVFNAERMVLEYASAEALRNLGYSRDALSKLTPMDIAPEFDAENLEAILAPLKRGQLDQINVNTELLRANGTRYPVEVHVRVFSRPDSTVFIAIAQDISARAAAEREIRHLANFTHVNPNPVIEVDPLLGTIFQNPAALRAFPGLKLQGWEHALLTGLEDKLRIPDENSVSGLRREISVAERWYLQTAEYQPESHTWLMNLTDISETKKMEEAFRNKSDELDQFFTTALDLLCIASVDGRFLRLNPEWEKVLGFSLAELEGSSFLELIHPDDKKETLAALKKLDNQEAVLSFTNRYRCKDSTYRWLEWRSYPSGKLVYAAARDITERRQTLMELWHSNRHLQQLVQASQALSRTLNSDEIYTALLNFLRGMVPFDILALLDYDADAEMLTRQFLWSAEKEIQIYPLPPEQYSAHGEIPACRVIKSGKPLMLNNFETEARAISHSQAEYRQKESTAEPEKLPRSALFVPLLQGSRVSGVIEVFSRKKNAYSEEAIHIVEGIAAQMALALENAHLFEQVRAELEERKRVEAERLLLADVINESVNEVYLFDAHTLKFKNANEGARRNLGYSMQELQQLTPFDLKPDLTQADFDALIAPLRSRDKALQIFETRHQRKDGTFYDVEVHLQLFDRPPQPVFLAVIQDITQRKLAEREIRELNAQLEERVRLRTAELQSANLELEAFSYSVSHDLRAPLRAIDGFVTILEEDYTSELDEEARRVISVIRANTRSMSRLIEDLLRYSRVSRAALVFESVDTAGLARAVYHELTNESDRKTVTFKIKRVPRLRGDPAMLRQVMMNLIANALKFSAKSENPAITISGRHENGEVVVCVEDNGAGFDMRYVDKMFNVFQRLHTNDDFDGSGVGLAIVKRIITRHGGRVWADGEVGKGARLWFALPDEMKGKNHGRSS